MRCLIINSYAGSLVLAARAQRLDIIGSYEDAGYGMELQQQNFTGIDFRSKRREWPEYQDLTDCLVLAHPPCAAFSVQGKTTSKEVRGVDNHKFACTLDVMSYALGNNCRALAIESVIPALEGARAVHDEHAARYGYDVYRVLQNAVTFNLAQWRPRFWIIFVRRGELGRMVFWHEPRYQALEQVVGQPGPCTIEEFTQRDMDKYRTKMKIAGISAGDVEDILAGEDYGILASVLRRKFNLGDMSLEAVKTSYLGPGFLTSMPRLLDPRKPATTVLYDNLWWCRERLLSVEEYCDVMGFPRDYGWGTKLRNYRAFLSRGVCPPVAEWVIQTVVNNLNSKGYETGTPLGARGKVIALGRNETADFLVAKKDISPDK